MRAGVDMQSCCGQTLYDTAVATHDADVVTRHLEQGKSAVHGCPCCLGATVHVDGAAGIIP